MLKILRNSAIVLLLALGLTVLPGGGSITDGVLVALTLIMFGAIALILARFWQASSLTRDTMTDRQRVILYCALGTIALMVAGADELLDSGAGTAAWLLIMAVSVWLIVLTWRQANTY